MAVDIETIRKIARLASIRVEEEALAGFAKEFSATLEFLEPMRKVDVENVEPFTSSWQGQLAFMADEVTVGNIQNLLLKDSPESREGFFVVPKVRE